MQPLYAFAKVGTLFDEYLRGDKVQQIDREWLRNFFDASSPGGPMTIEVVVRATGLSKRKIQRKLAEQGTSFKEVLDDWRYQRAAELLFDSTVSKAQIATRLHYAHSPSFYRALDRWASA
ncbi:MAG: helix-turn-helix domain-containing protein [Aeoliella sp.]